MNTIYFSHQKEFSHPFLKKNIAFTGTLEKMTRIEATKLVRLKGGNVIGNVNAQTDFLILGKKQKRKGISSKEMKARQLEIQGNEIQIVQEEDFYWLIEMNSK